MTNIITRYFDSTAQAQAVREELIVFQRFPRQIISLYDDPEGLVDLLTASGVQSKTAAAYQVKLAKGGSVMLVRALNRPLGVARITREVTAEMGAADMRGMIEEVFVKDPFVPVQSVLTTHPHITMRRLDQARTTHHMANWPLPLISRRKPFTRSLLEPHGRMANLFLPLISRRKPFTGSIFSRHARMANFPIGLISQRKPYDGFAFDRHKRMADFPIPLISQRKPYTGSLLARHARMANWPFPHLINGKPGNNSLMPGGPRMANFPINLISKREPYAESAIPRHGRMANFPIGLISRRKPYDEFAIPRHGRMADVILPLVVRRSESGEGWSLSRMLGLSTLSRR